MSTVIQLNPGGAAFHLEVASRLRIGLSVRGIKRNVVAKAIGMTASSFSKRLRGHLVMDLGEVDEIAEVTGICRDWLLTGSGPMLDPEWVPPAGFEPAAFCSGEPGNLRRLLATVVPIRPKAAPIDDNVSVTG